MSKIIGFFEAYVDKIVLAVVGVVCAGLLLHYVILGPNKVEYEGKEFNPGRIDVEISKEAEFLKRKLNEPPKAPEPYMPRLGGPIKPNDPFREGIRSDLRNGFRGLFNSPLSNIDTNLYPPKPSSSSLEMASVRKYSLPFIGEVNEVAVGHIRAVAYVPMSTVDKQNVYERGNSEPNDIDLVTVEGKFNVAGLYSRFQECFAGKAVKKAEWYDPCLAKPVFAAVQLQRQVLNGDGTWSDWENVPRTKIDPDKKLFEVIENVQNLPPGGLTVRMLQFDNRNMTMSLLQPETYMIASANEEWFPPTLHDKYLEQQRQREMEAKREALEKAKEERERKLEERLDERRSSGRGGDARSRTGRTGVGGGDYGGLYGGASSRSGSRTTTRRSRSSTTDTRRVSDRAASTERLSGLRQNERDTSTRATRDTSEDDVYEELDAITISPKTEFAKMSEPLVFWAYDDTVEPEKSYRYRIRLGVFNPIAGTSQFSEQYKSYRNKVVLWSEFSDVTETVDIPGKSYFFASDIQEASKTVTVEVCKYALGYWYSEKFPVRQGEVIGQAKPVVLKPEEQQANITAPQTIDYYTGVLFVDAMPVNNWSGGRKLVARDYYDMLYSSDGVNIEHMPVKTANWGRELQIVYSDVQRSLRAQKKPLREWGSTSRSSIQVERRQRTPAVESDSRAYYEELLRRGGDAGGAAGRR